MSHDRMIAHSVAGPAPKPLTPAAMSATVAPV